MLRFLQSSGVELGPVLTIISLALGSTGITSLYLLRVRFRKLANESSDLAMVKLQRAMDAQEKIWARELEFCRARITQLEGDLTVTRGELERARRECDRLTIQLEQIQALKRSLKDDE